MSCSTTIFSGRMANTTGVPGEGGTWRERRYEAAGRSQSSVFNPATRSHKRTGGSNKIGHEERLGMVIQRVGRVELDDPMGFAAHDRNPVGHGQGLFLIVGDVNRRDSRAGDADR